MCTTRLSSLMMNLRQADRPDFATYQRIVTTPRCSDLVALSVPYATLRVADLAALCRLTELACRHLVLLGVGSDVSLPELRLLACEHFVAGDASTSPRSVALALPLLERLDLRVRYHVDHLALECSSVIWPNDQCLPHMSALVNVKLSALPLAMVRTCATIKELDMSTSTSTPHDLMECVPRLRILAGHLRELDISSLTCFTGFSGACLDLLLVEVATACPHLTEVCIAVSSNRSSVLTVTGLVGLAHLRKLKRVEVRGSKDVTKAGVVAFALKWSVEAIHMSQCVRFKRPDAQSLMNLVKRPYLDINVT